MRAFYPSWRLFTALNLLILGGFLVFWLRGEYADEYASLQNEAHLQLAKSLLQQRGMDFNQLLETLEGDRSFQVIQMEVPTPTDSTMSSDVATRLRAFTNEQDSSGTAISIIQGYGGASAASGSPWGGGLPWTDSTFVHQLQERTQDRQAQITSQALRNILPQVIFALFLFAFSALATYLVQRNFRERQALLEGKNTFISNMTHELQTPVATISVALEAIQDFDVKAEPEKADRYLSAARQELRRLSRLIDRVLSFSQMDAGQTQYQMALVDLGELIPEVIQQLELAIQQKQALVEFPSPGQTFPLRADAFHLRRALYNLLDNSLKYGPAGVAIALRVEDRDAHWWVAVEDDGPGIAPEEQAKVFDRFYRVGRGAVHTVKGYGLGLSDVRAVVAAHGGRVEIGRAHV